jgi:hypothetical protein
MHTHTNTRQVVSIFFEGMESIRECFVLAFTTLRKRQDELHSKHTQTARLLDAALHNVELEKEKVRDLEMTIHQLGEKLLHTVEMWFGDEQGVVDTSGAHMQETRNTRGLVKAQKQGPSEMKQADDNKSRPNQAHASDRSGTISSRSHAARTARDSPAREPQVRDSPARDPQVRDAPVRSGQRYPGMQRPGTVVRGVVVGVGEEPADDDDEGYAFPLQ